jgi:hypothetical protein
MRGGNKILDAETLITDDLLKVPNVTESQRFFYEKTLLQAQNIREGINLALADFPTAEDIGAMFKHVVALGLSQKSLAVRFGVTTGTLSRWVSCENPPREFVREAMAEELGKVVDYVVARLEAYKERPNFRKRRPKQPRRVVAFQRPNV